MKNEKQHRLLFIIPAVIIAIILIICIAVAVSSKSGEKGKKKGFPVCQCDRKYAGYCS